MSPGDRWYVIDSLDDMHPVKVEVHGDEAEWPDQVLDHWLVSGASHDYLESGCPFTVYASAPTKASQSFCSRRSSIARQAVPA